MPNQPPPLPPCRYGNPCFIRAFRHIRLQPLVLLDATQICCNMKDQRVRGERGRGTRFRNNKKAANTLIKLVRLPVQRTWCVLVLVRKCHARTLCTQCGKQTCAGRGVSVCLSVSPYVSLPNMTISQIINLQCVYFGLFSALE